MLHLSSTAAVATVLAVCLLGVKVSFARRVQPPYVCAHGGNAATHPPNTAAAYTSALEVGADCIEVDAALTSDLQLVALHDRDLQKLLGQPAVKVQDFSWADLQSLTWPSGEPLLTVSQAVVLTAHLVQLLIIDLKTSDDVSRVVQHGDAPMTEADAFLAALEQLRLPLHNKTVVWGKSDELIQQVQQAGLNVATGFSVMRAPGTVFENPTRMQEPEVVAVYHEMVDLQLLQLLKYAEKTVIAWTVDEVEEMQRLLRLGVDGILTNAPALLREAVQQASLRVGDAVPCRTRACMQRRSSTGGTLVTAL